MIAVFFEV
jgi:heme-degrading monooxygenase HmoA